MNSQELMRLSDALTRKVTAMPLPPNERIIRTIVDQVVADTALVMEGTLTIEDLEGGAANVFIGAPPEVED